MKYKTDQQAGLNQRLPHTDKVDKFITVSMIAIRFPESAVTAGINQLGIYHQFNVFNNSPLICRSIVS